MKTTTMPFQMYPEEKHFWSFNDYGAVLDAMHRFDVRGRVLEFGPGSSTLALLEGGASWIVAYEDDPHWLAHYERTIVEKHAEVILLKYDWRDPLDIWDQSLYSFALIDGPAETARRPACIEFAIKRSAIVMVALECNEGSTLMRDTCIRLAEQHRRAIEIMETGPLAGAFALLT